MSASFGAPCSDSRRMSPGGRPSAATRAEQLVDELVRELVDEVPLPVVALHAVRRVEQALLLGEGARTDTVVEEPGRRAQLAQLGRVRVRAGVAGDDHERRRQRLVEPEHGLAAQVARRARHDVAEDADRVADAGPAVGEQAADDALQRVQAEVETRRDAEVPATPAEGPEELRVRRDHAPVGRDELGADEVVAREAVLRRQVADAPAQRQAADTRRPDDPSGRDEAVGLRRRVEVEPGRAAARARDPRLGVDLDRAHLREVDHEPVVENAVPGRIVAASTHGDLEPVRLREREGGCDVVGHEAPGDHRGATVDERVEAPACGVEAGVVREDHLAGQRLLQVGDVHVRRPRRARAAAPCRRPQQVPSSRPPWPAQARSAAGPGLRAGTRS